MYTVHIVHYFIPGTFDGRPYIEKAMEYTMGNNIQYKLAITVLVHSIHSVY